MQYIQDFDSYNESLKQIITGSALLLSLLSNQVKGQESRKDLRVKALLSQFDTIGSKKIADSLSARHFQLIQSQRSIENKFLVTSGTGITAKDAIEKAQEEMNTKIEFLGRKGAQDIWLYEEGSKNMETLHRIGPGPKTGNFHVVIITEILNKKIKKGSLYDPQLDIYR